jgi:hypothetical protein
VVCGAIGGGSGRRRANRSGVGKGQLAVRSRANNNATFALLGAEGAAVLDVEERAQAHQSAVPASPTQTQKLARAASTDPTPTPTDLPTPLQLPHTSTNKLGAFLPTEVPPRCVQVPFLLQTPVLAVPWAHFSFPEDQATSQTQAANSQ